MARPRQELEPAPDRTPGGPAAWLFGAWIGGLVAWLVVAAWVLGKDEGQRHAENAAKPVATARAGATPTTEPAVPAGPGKQLFVAKCGSCHALKAAGTNGTTGPSLDDLQPDAAPVKEAIKNGGVGSGVMPKGLAEGDEATQIADFVAQAAGG